MSIPQDDYLAEGYFRAAHTVRQTRYVFVDGDYFATVWSRVPLGAYALRKSHRKLLRRVRRRYTVSVGPYEQRDDQDALYATYQADHPLEVAEEVAEVLGYQAPVVPFRTYAVRLVDGDGHLAAFSCFDVGESSAASLFGAYAPAHARESLGFATMLLEMDYGRGRGLDYYYPGYCVPGLAPFAYKLRLPDLEGRSFVDAGWEPMRDVLARPLPKDLLGAALSELEELLLSRGVPCHQLVMPLAENFHANNAPVGPLPHVQMLAIDSPVPLGDLYVGYEATESQYEVWIAAAHTDLRDEEDVGTWIHDFPPEADLRVYAWRIPVLAFREPQELLKYFQAGSMLSRLLAGG